MPCARHVNRVVQHFSGHADDPIHLTERDVLALHEACRTLSCPHVRRLAVQPPRHDLRQDLPRPRSQQGRATCPRLSPLPRHVFRRPDRGPRRPVGHNRAVGPQARGEDGAMRPFPAWPVTRSTRRPPRAVRRNFTSAASRPIFPAISCPPRPCTGRSSYPCIARSTATALCAVPCSQRVPADWQRGRPHAGRRSRGPELFRLSPVTFALGQGVVCRMSSRQFALRYQRREDGHDVQRAGEQAQHSHGFLRRLPPREAAGTQGRKIKHRVRPEFPIKPTQPLSARLTFHHVGWWISALARVVFETTIADGTSVWSLLHGDFHKSGPGSPHRRAETV